MAKKAKYKCPFCEKAYETLEEADSCFEKHDLYFVPMTSQEMNQLIRYIYDQQNPPVSLIGRIKKIMRKKAGRIN